MLCIRSRRHGRLLDNGMHSIRDRQSLANSIVSALRHYALETSVNDLLFGNLTFAAAFSKIIHLNYKSCTNCVGYSHVVFWWTDCRDRRRIDWLT